MESNILTSGLSISAEGLLIGLYRPNPSLILASSGFELLFSIYYYANYLLNIRMSIKIKVKLEELKSYWFHVLTLGDQFLPKMEQQLKMKFKKSGPIDVSVQVK
jgi:hypothetical protein